MKMPRAALHFFASVLLLGSCSSTGKKPVSLMIFASASMKAADRAQAERLAPDLYRKAENEFWKAKRAYAAKDFETAHRAAVDARHFAEQAEKAAEVKASTAGLDE